VISLSFGYRQEQTSIKDAIRKAEYDRHDSILFFAAASNFGANEPEMFPASHESVISIRATDPDGGFERYNPPRNKTEGIVYGTLGKDVPSVALSSSSQGIAYDSGTSVATPIAAGAAAAIMGYVNSQSHRSNFQGVKRKLRTRRGMLALFGTLATQSMDEGYYYMNPWSLEKLSEEDRWSKISAAVSSLP
jgi:subtilisin family serine protease